MSSYNYGVGYYKNKQFLFDKEDYDLIKEYIWVIADNDYVKSYYKTDGTKNKKAIRLHVLVMHSDPKKYDVDHIHHNLLDNRKSQLRKVLHCENIMNTKLYSNNTTGVKGVYWDKSRNKWMVTITAYKKTYHIGRFDKFEDAIKARHEAERKYQKDFYNKDLNKKGGNSMIINEIKDYINNHNFYDMEDLLDELGENINMNYIENLYGEEHRWFTVETNVYEFMEGAKSLGYLAISEIGTIKSEMMNIEDCGVTLEAFNVKKVIRESFEVIE